MLLHMLHPPTTNSNPSGKSPHNTLNYLLHNSPQPRPPLQHSNPLPPADPLHINQRQGHHYTPMLWFMAFCKLMWLFCLALYSQPSLVTVPPEHINIVQGGSVLPECAPLLRLALAPKLAVLARSVPPSCAYIILRH